MIHPKIISDMVKELVPAEKPAGSNREVRLQGLAMMTAGALLAPVIFFAAWCLILILVALFGPGILGYGVLIAGTGAAAVPLVLAFVGWLQLVTGVPFSRLESTFKEGGLGALGILVLVLGSAVAFIAALIYVADIGFARGWF
jgi:hypothetical protein